MRNKAILLLLALCLSTEPSFSAGLPSTENSRQTLPTLGQAEHPQRSSDKAEKRALRTATQKKAALSWGAQTGYAKRTEIRNQWLLSHAEDLDRTFTFRPFLAESEHVLLPSVDAGHRAFRLENATASDSTLVSYRIHEVARVVSIPPTFRDYLMLDPGKPKTVNPILLPKNSREKSSWKKWTEAGWRTGEKLSDRAFRIGIRRLVRAIEGRIRFSELELTGQIERPDWAESPAATLRTGQVLEIGSTVLRITRAARFTDQRKWKPLNLEERP